MKQPVEVTVYRTTRERATVWIDVDIDDPEMTHSRVYDAAAAYVDEHCPGEWECFEPGYIDWVRSRFSFEVDGKRIER